MSQDKPNFIHTPKEETEGYVLDDVKLRELLLRSTNVEIIDEKQSEEDRFYYELGIKTQYLSEKLFEHPAIIQQYNKLESQLFHIPREKYDNFVVTARDFFNKQGVTVKDTVTDQDYINLFLSLRNSSIRVKVEEKFDLGANSYDSLSLAIREDQGFLTVIENALNAPFLQLEQEQIKGIKMLSFSLLTNRYARTLLRVQTAFGTDSTGSVILKLNGEIPSGRKEDWETHIGTGKGSNLLTGVTSYKKEFKSLTDENKNRIIKRVLNYLNDVEQLDSNIVEKNLLIV